MFLQRVGYDVWGGAPEDTEAQVAFLCGRALPVPKVARAVCVARGGLRAAALMTAADGRVWGHRRSWRRRCRNRWLSMATASTGQGARRAPAGAEGTGVGMA